jgi:PhnB protein
MPKVKPIPEGYHSISPSITCKNASKAIDFYKKVFGATEVMRMPGPTGEIMHAELKIGDSHIFLNDEFPGMAVAPSGSGPAPCQIFVYTEDVDSVFNRAIQEGARSTMPLADQFWGDRYGKFVDPFGHHWGVATHVEDVAPEDMQRRMKEAMAKTQQSKAAGHN